MAGANDPLSGNNARQGPMDVYQLAQYLADPLCSPISSLEGALTRQGEAAKPSQQATT